MGQEIPEKSKSGINHHFPDVPNSFSRSQILRIWWKNFISHPTLIWRFTFSPPGGAPLQNQPKISWFINSKQKHCFFPHNRGRLRANHLQSDLKICTCINTNIFCAPQSTQSPRKPSPHLHLHLRPAHTVTVLQNSKSCVLNCQKLTKFQFASNSKTLCPCHHNLYILDNLDPSARRDPKQTFLKVL